LKWAHIPVTLVRLPCQAATVTPAFILRPIFSDQKGNRKARGLSDDVLDAHAGFSETMKTRHILPLRNRQVPSCLNSRLSAFVPFLCRIFSYFLSVQRSANATVAHMCQPSLYLAGCCGLQTVPFNSRACSGRRICSLVICHLQGLSRRSRPSVWWGHCACSSR
jgi:hypothetical protein